MTEKVIAILVDAENISSTYIKRIISFVRGQGSIAVQRVYNDWSTQNSKSWQDILTTQPFTAVQQFKNNEKQVIDKAIIMDAIQIAIERKEIDTFCIVASDNGYSQLVLRLREFGKFIIGIGEKDKVKPRLIEACNDFRYIENIKPDGEYESTSEEDIDSLSDLIQRAYVSTPKTAEGGVLLSKLKERVKDIKSDFDENAYGSTSFVLLMKTLESEYKVDLMQDKKTWQAFRKISTKVLHEGIIYKIEPHKSFGFIKTDGENEYFFHFDYLPENWKQSDLKPGRKVKFVSVKEPNLKAKIKSEKNGRAESIEFIND